MKIRKPIIFIITILLFLNLILIIAIYDQKEDKLNMVEVNDICESLNKEWNNLNQENLPGLNYGLDYVVLDIDNDFIIATKSGLNEDINQAIVNRDTIIDIYDNGIHIGKLIIYNNSNEITNQYKKNLLTFSIIFNTFIGGFCIIFLLKINKSILNPFNKLKDFARNIAGGNLDIPLIMDKGNHFGAFTESFDLMREELKTARENERKANQSKKELVASLSHDIKTPIASIKAVSEIMQIKTPDDNIRKQLAIINSKADQINNLITNMFNATLEELQELKVSLTEEPSYTIYEIIKKSDYNHQVTILNTADCIVVMDSLRLSQVIDNIISNSYKYANTSINISIRIIDKYLEVSFKDYGLGVPKDELPLLFNKFYRAKNSQGKSGTGLGLYISKYLMEKMHGDIECLNTNDGFLVILKLLIA